MILHDNNEMHAFKTHVFSANRALRSSAANVNVGLYLQSYTWIARA